MGNIYLRREQDVVWREIDEYGVLLKVNTGDYCEINELGVFIWGLLAQEMTLDELASRVAAAFDASEQTATEDIVEFARDLEERGMLVVAERNPNSE